MRNVRGIAVLQIWLMMFGMIGFVFMMDDVSAITYDVVVGDTLSKIAEANGISVQDILNVNPGITNPNLIRIGQSITIPGPVSVPVVAPVSVPVVSIPSAPSSILTEASSITGWKGAPVFNTGSTLGAGTYTSGTIGGHSLLSGQTAVVTQVEAGYSTVIQNSAGEVVKDLGVSETVAAGSEVVGSGGTAGSRLSKLLGAGGGSVADALLTGASWAVGAYITGTMVGGLLGFNEENSEALGTAAAAGAGAYGVLSTWSATSGTWIASPFVGIGIGAAVFLVTYKEVETTVVTFDCMPWQAPTGGNACEVCNDDDLACSEYRCNSLGQSCELVNQGTNEEKCVYVNPRDVTPPIIRPNYEMLSRDYQYKNVKTSPPGPGFEIENSASTDGCLKAFTPLKFGITTDEPSQCKIDFNYTDSFDDMIAYVGGSNFYAYNHSETFSLPGAEILESAGFALENGKDMQFYLRCKDKNGNENSASYAVEFCVDPSPDTTAPVVEATSILNGGCVAENTDSAEVVFYVNEPAECKWSFQNQHYDLMENGMICSPSYNQINAAQLFGCAAGLTGIPRDGANYYVRCKDQPGVAENDRNVNTESFEFSLRGSTGLILKNIRPNATVFGGVSPAPIELYAETLFGCNEGLAICEWSNDGTNYIQFFDTNNEDGIHTQRLDLGAGNHNYYIRCVDAGGNVATEAASFRVDIDTNAPVVARVYEEGGMLKIVTVRDSECSYTLDNCDFSFAQGVEMPYGNTTVHVAEWSEDNTYYIKCRDEFLNEGAGCSVVVRPTENFL